MRVVARRTLMQFAENCRSEKDHAALKIALDAWFYEASHANWKTMADIKSRYAHASIINSERVVFNIKGNDYRLIAALDFKRSSVWIKWIGTHRDYDKVNAATVDHA